MGICNKFNLLRPSGNCSCDFISCFCQPIKKSKRRQSSPESQNCKGFCNCGINHRRRVDYRFKHTFRYVQRSNYGLGKQHEQFLKNPRGQEAIAGCPPDFLFKKKRFVFFTESEIPLTAFKNCLINQFYYGRADAFASARFFYLINFDYAFIPHFRRNIAEKGNRGRRNI